MRFAFQLYKIAGPRLGNRLVEPCNLLCLGDLRPYASWNGYIRDPQPQDEEVIDRLNQFLVPRGYSLHPKQANPQGQVATYSVHSLAGLEWTTSRSKLAWVPKYSRATGWPGYYAWKEQIHKNLAGVPDEWHKVEGIMLGYSDSAVSHYSEIAFNWPLSVDVWFPGSLFFNCGQPVPGLRWQDCRASDVLEFEQSWGGFLQKAYSEQQLQPFLSDPEFMAERQDRNDQKIASFHNQDPYNSAAAERTAADKLEELLRLTPLHADLSKLALLAQLPQNGQFTLKDWIWRGAIPGLDPQARRFYQVFAKSHPQDCLQLRTRQLESRLRTTLRAESAPTKSTPAEVEAWTLQLEADQFREVIEQLAPPLEHQLWDLYQGMADHPRVRTALELAMSGKGPLADLWLKYHLDKPE